ncbi:hypothetical protein MLD38_014328 [Melastoma candidum]|uniref:Uncharacterized protein n=1 Tax=Melastoma candidum TaxID=119954 RepID=A0ACB9RKV2_9MYRT|nr:hypothetical protein MLD38_014328 [Melastoma candidum]
METDSPTPAEVVRKILTSVRALVHTMCKNLSFSSQSLLIDLHLLLKRTKSFSDLLLTHYSSFTCRPGHPDSLSFISPSSLHEVEFSCSNTPVNNAHFSFKKRPASHHHKKSHAGSKVWYGKKYGYDEAVTVAAVQRVLDMLNRGSVGEDEVGSVMASPMVLPGFGGGKSPAPVRPLRITDSPFPLKEDDAGDGGQVDMRADEFIRNFYRDLRHEKCMSPYYYGFLRG